VTSLIVTGKREWKLRAAGRNFDEENNMTIVIFHNLFFRGLIDLTSSNVSEITPITT